MTTPLTLILPAELPDAVLWLSERLARFDPAQQAGDLPDPHDATGARPAAVLIPLVWRPGAHGILLTRRTEGLRHHAGQVSFPGGKREPGDADAAACALREAQEEIALAPQLVRLAGELPAYVTVTGFAVTPVVGLLPPPAGLVPQPGEVAEIFELPLEQVLDVRQYERHAVERDGSLHQFLSLSHGDHFVWGATAAMLRMFASAVTGR